MEKNMMMLEIMNLYDENESLRKTVAWLSRTENDIETKMLEAGKEYVYKSVVWTYGDTVDCWYENYMYEYTPYEEWLELVVPKRNLPSWMSYDQFIEYYSNELKEEYAKAKAKLIEKVEDNSHGTNKKD